MYGHNNFFSSFGILVGVYIVRSFVILYDNAFKFPLEVERVKMKLTHRLRLNIGLENKDEQPEMLQMEELQSFGDEDTDREAIKATAAEIKGRQMVRISEHAASIEVASIQHHMLHAKCDRKDNWLELESMRNEDDEMEKTEVSAQDTMAGRMARGREHRELLKLVRSVPQLGIKAGEFQVIKRESTTDFLSFVTQQVSTLLIAFP